MHYAHTIVKILNLILIVYFLQIVLDIFLEVYDNEYQIILRQLRYLS